MITGDHEYLYNITFFNATAQGRGGAVFLQDNTNITFDSCRFLGCEALGIANNTWDDYKSEYDHKGYNYKLTGHGGAIAFDIGATDALIKNSEFIYNYARRDGGAINIALNSFNATIENCNFTNNSAGDDGGAINWEGNLGFVKYSKFYNNTAVAFADPVTGASSSRGGTVFIKGDNVTIDGSSINISTVLHNKGDLDRTDGGAMVITGTNTHILNSQFDTCWSPYVAGAIRVIGNYSLIDNCSFINCNATKDGGALYIEGLYCNLSNSTFDDNFVGDDGGAIFWQGDLGTIYNITCTNNRCEDLGYSTPNGGTISLVGHNVTIAKSSFKQTYAKVSGGAIFITGNYINITDTSFDNCRVYKNITSVPGKAYVNGGGALYLFGDYTSILNCTFHNCEGREGGAVYIQGNDVKIDKSSTNFTNAVTGGAIYIYGIRANIINSTFDLSYASTSGGAIYSTGSYSNVIDSNFTDNLAEYDGGAIYWQGTSQFDNSKFNVVDGCTFVRNTAYALSGLDSTRGGGAIFWSQKGSNGAVKNSKFINNSVQTNHKADGGAILWDQSFHGIIDNCIFDGNYITSIMINNNKLYIQGGAVFLRAANNYTISNCIFKNCWSDKEGGAMYLSTRNPSGTMNPIGVWVINVTFINNTAKALGPVSSDNTMGGGAVFVKECTRAYFENVTFINNTANNGGAFSLSPQEDTIEFNKCTFIGNKAEDDGGAIWVGKFSLKLYDAVFYDNVADGRGGAIFNLGGFSYSNLTFINNSAYQGGAISWFRDGEKIIQHLVFINNTAYQGGAMYLPSLTKSSTNRIQNNNFTNNFAYYGGAIYAGVTNVYISNNNFTKNSADYGGAIYQPNAIFTISITNSIFDENNAIYGGALDLGATSNSDAANKIVQYCNFTNNKAVDGGAIYVNGSYQRVLNCIFDKNNASGNGGSIYVVKSLSSTTIQDSTFTNSYARNGGAIYKDNSATATLIIRNDTFIDNTAARNGGAVLYIMAGEKYRDYNDFDERATVSPTTMRTTYSEIGITDSLFRNNNDYQLIITTIALAESPTIVVYLANPTDQDPESIYLIVNVTNSTSQVGAPIIVNKDNYDLHYNPTSKMVYVSVEDLRINGNYTISVGFSDDDYMYKEFSKNVTAKGIAMGEFELLQKTIEDELTIQKTNPYDYYIITLSRDYTFTRDYYNNRLDTKCINLTNIDRPIIIDGNGSLINAKGFARIFNITASNVTLINFRLAYGNASGNFSDGVNMGGAIFWAGKYGSLVDSQLYNNYANRGGAIYYNSSAINCLINGSTFLNNTADSFGGAIDCNASRLGIFNNEFNFNTANVGGGLCREINATLGYGFNNTFRSNIALTNGSALAWIHAKNISINSYYFYDNVAGTNGGAIHANEGSINCEVRNCVFDNNSVNGTGLGYGGAIDWNSKEGLVFNSTFTRNHASYGGAMYVGGDSEKINITESTFSENYATLKGGAVDIRVSSVIINSSNFYYNNATNGGALYIGGEGHMNYVYSSIFVGNRANKGTGGAIDWVASSGTILDSDLTGNCANYGGGIYFGGLAAQSIVRRCNFTDNHAKYTGGAIDCNSSNLLLYDSRFDSNYAQFGAALCREVSALGGNGSNNLFINNHAYISGAALGWMGSADIKIINYTFINNSADVSGGAIYASPTSHNCSIIDSYFENNFVTNETLGVDSFTWIAWDETVMEFAADITYNATLVNKTIMGETVTTYYYAYGDNYREKLGIGGAVYVIGADSKIINSDFIKNSAKLGGSIYVGANSGSTFVEESKFESNTAYENGGAIYLYASAVHIDDSEFIDNLAIDGAALYVGGIGTSNQVHSSIFIGNNATGYGAGIYWRASAGEIKDSQFDSNNAYIGGAMYLNGVSANTNITNSTFRFNTAIKNGGAIDSNAANIGIYNITFEANYAGEYGAALCRESGSTRGHGQNNTFLYNHAGIAGAAIAWLNVKNMAIDHYYFINNTAGYSGGAIYVSRNSDNSTIDFSYFEGNEIANNLEGYGGAMAILGNGSNIKNSEFVNNYAFEGGAIYTGVTSGNIHILNVTFKENEATANGGAVEILGLAVSLNHTNFTSNTAGKSGGAIFVNSTENSNVIDRSVFNNNKATEDGGAINWFSYPGDVLFSNFTNNQAEYGGAIHLSGISNNDKIANVIFINNTATKNGGAIDCNASYICLNNTLFINNYAGEFGAGLCREAGAANGFGENNTFIDNKAGISGAALAWLGVNGIDIHNYTFINNTASKSGGGIYVRSDSANCKVSNCKFDNNYVTDIRDSHGGAIDWHGTRGHIFNTTFENSFALNGGSIYVAPESNMMNITESRFIASRALSEGGSIDLYGDNVYIIKTNFSYSVSSLNGGAISAHNSNNAIIDGCLFEFNVGAGFIDEANTASGEGGAIFWENANNVTISNTKVFDTESHANGAVSLINCNNSKLYKVHFKGEITIRNGGSVSWVNSNNITIDSCDFLDTAASYNGGSIFLNNTDKAVVKNSYFNNTSALWGNGGGIYADGNVTFDNNTLCQYEAFDDYAGGIFVAGGNSTIINSTFIGPDAIWVGEHGEAHVSENYITGAYPNKDVKYLEKPYNPRYNKYDYAVWNDGKLYLNKNTFDYIVFNNGTITSPTTLWILDNITINETWNTTYNFWANITDDNDNTIISVCTLDTWNDNSIDGDKHYAMPYNFLQVPLAYQGKFQIMANDSGLINPTIYYGTINVKLPTVLTINYTNTQQEQIPIVVKLSVPVESNYTFSWDKLKIKINGVSFDSFKYTRNIVNSTIGGIHWYEIYVNFTEFHMPVGTYTITADYEGDDYHWNAYDSKEFALFSHSIWIKVHANDILYGGTLLVNVTSNAFNTVNGRITIRVDGKIVSVPLKLDNETGSYLYVLPNTDYPELLEPGEHMVSVIFQNGTYYETTSNESSFRVYSLNTTVNATTTNFTYGENLKINVTVEKNATGYIAIRIDGVIFTAPINNGTAYFDIRSVTVGNYTIPVIYYPDNNHYNRNSTNISFVVSATGNYNMTIISNNLTYGQNATVCVLMPEGASGNVTVYIDGKLNKTLPLDSDYVALWENILIDAGLHNITVHYNGCDVYAPQERNVTVFVAPAQWVPVINIEEGIYSQNTTFSIEVPDDFNSTYLNLTVEGVTYAIQITNGKGNKTFNNISAGMHDAVLSFNGNARYVKNNLTASYHIVKLTPTINLTRIDDNVIVATVDGNAYGNVSFIVNGIEYVVNLTNGNATLSGKLIVGNNSVVAIYNPDGNHTSTQISKNYVLGKIASSVNVTANDTAYGTPVKVTVQVGENQTGFVTITVNGKNYSAKINKGNATFTLIDLDVGNYTIDVVYEGDDTYLNSTNHTSFNVTKLNTDLVINGGNSTYGEKAVIVVTVDAGVEGNITIKLNNTQQTTMTEKIINGKAVFNLTKLAAGNYTVNAVYNGSDIYNINSTESATFEIKKANPDLLFDLSSFVIYDNATMSISINDEIVNEAVNVSFDSDTYTLFVNTPSGSNIIKTNVISQYKSYDIVVEYGGNENFTSVKYEFERTPTKIYTYGIKINANNIIVGDENIITVEVPNYVDDVVLYVNGHSFRNTSFTNNKAVFNVTSLNLKEGVYTVTAFVNDTEFDHVNFTSIFTVNKTYPAINITVVNQSSIYVGQTVKIIVSVPLDVSDNITIMIDGKEYSKKPVSGNATFEIEAITFGNKTITAIYNGDDKYRINATTAEFNVSKYNPVIDSIVGPSGDTVLGSNVTITVTMANVNNGTLLIEVANHNYTVEIVNKVANLTVALPIGNYTAKAYFIEDDKYNANESSEIQFKVVSKLTPEIIITAPSEVNVGEAVNITVSTNGYNLTVWINDVEQTITDGNISFTPTKAGLYTIVAKVSENNTVYGASNFTVFNAHKLNATLIIGEIVPELDKEFDITVLNITDGEIIIKVNDIVIPNAKFTPTVPGVYVITVESAETDKYNAGFNMTSFSIDVKNATWIDIVAPTVVKVGETINISVSTNGYNLTVWINGEKQIINDGNITYYVDSAGINIIDATTTENDQMYGVSKSIMFESVKNKPTLIISEIGNVKVGDNVTIAVGGITDGSLTIKLNGVEIANNTKFTIPSAGRYTITVESAETGAYYAGFNLTTFEALKLPTSINVTAEAIGDEAIITVSNLPTNATGYVIIKVNGTDYVININSTNELKFIIPKTGKYDVVATYMGDDKYGLSNATTSFNATSTSKDVIVEVPDVVASGDVVVKVIIPEDAKGNITVTIGNQTKTITAKGGENDIVISNVGPGSYDVVTTYSGDDRYSPKTITNVITVISSINVVDTLTRGVNSPYDYEAEFLDKNGLVLKNTNVQFVVKGKTYTVKTDDKGIARLPGSTLKVGSYSVTSINPVTGEQVTKKLSIVERLTDNHNVKMYFHDGTTYSVRVIGDNGKPVGAGEIVSISINGVSYPEKTNSKGYAKLTINLKPGKYKVYAEYKGTKVSNKIKVKQVLKVKKTIKLKKPKKFALKAKLKGPNKKGQKIIFKFKGKKYKAKTNKKGLAKVIIKKKIAKKLKKGKKYKYSANYFGDVVKGKVKVKK